MLASDEKNLTKTLASEMTRFRHYLIDRKSTRLNSSHSQISYAVFCLKKKKKNVCRSHLVLSYLARLIASSPPPSSRFNPAATVTHRVLLTHTMTHTAPNISRPAVPYS